MNQALRIWCASFYTLLTPFYVFTYTADTQTGINAVISSAFQTAETATITAETREYLQLTPTGALFQAINRTHTQLGHALLYERLTHPYVHSSEIQALQEQLREVIENQELYETLYSLLQEYAQQEKRILSFWDEHHVEHVTRHSRYFAATPILNLLPKSFVDYCDKQPQILSALNTLYYGIGAYAVINSLTMAIKGFTHIRSLGKKYLGNKPLTEFDRHKTGIAGTVQYINKPLKIISKISFPFLAAHKLHSAVHSHKQKDRTVREAQQANDSLKLLISIVRKVDYLVHARHTLATSLPIIQQTHDLLDQTGNSDPSWEYLVEQLSQEPGTLRAPLYTGGHTLALYNTISAHKQSFIKPLSLIAYLDLLVSLATLYKENEGSAHPYSFASFLDSVGMNVQGVWEPGRATHHISLHLPENGRNALIVVGASGSGKTTTLRTAQTSVVLAQAFGIAPAQSCVIHPIKLFLTHMPQAPRVDDRLAKDIQHLHTLFNELHRAKRHKQACLICIDGPLYAEPENEQKAFIEMLARRMNFYPNVVAMIATHVTTDGSTAITRDIDALSTPASTMRKTTPPDPPSGRTLVDLMEEEGFDSSLIKHIQKHLKQS